MLILISFIEFVMQRFCQFTFIGAVLDFLENELVKV